VVLRQTEGPATTNIDSSPIPLKVKPQIQFINSQRRIQMAVEQSRNSKAKSYFTARNKDSLAGDTLSLEIHPSSILENLSSSLIDNIEASSRS